jgi:hypothetical protein
MIILIVLDLNLSVPVRQVYPPRESFSGLHYRGLRAEPKAGLYVVKVSAPNHFFLQRNAGCPALSLNVLDLLLLNRSKTLTSSPNLLNIPPTVDD